MTRILIALLLSSSTTHAALRPRPTNPAPTPSVPPATSWQPPWSGGAPVLR